MKICIVGAGSIGGYLGVKFALAGEDVTLIARGENLAALRSHGIRLLTADGEQLVTRQPRVRADIDAVGPQDLVILAMKAHQIEPVAAQLPALFDEQTVVIPMQNGLPWWYFHKHGGIHDGTPVLSADPNGTIGAHIDPERIVGCVVYPACEMAAPGVVRHVEGNRFPLGELDGATTPRIEQLAALFIRAGFKSPILDNIRAEIWLKLWGNLSFNPISALTHATLEDICRFDITRQLAVSMMLEAQAVANKLGIEFRVPLEKRIAGAEKVGKHKTSMLQDIEARRTPELDALVGAVLELGRLTATPTPSIAAVYACTKLLAKTVCATRERTQACERRSAA